MFVLKIISVYIELIKQMVGNGKLFAFAIECTNLTVHLYKTVEFGGGNVLV